MNAYFSGYGPSGVSLAPFLSFDTKMALAQGRGISERSLGIVPSPSSLPPVASVTGSNVSPPAPGDTEPLVPEGSR